MEYATRVACGFGGKEAYERSRQNAARNTWRMIRRFKYSWAFPIRELKYETEDGPLLLPYHSPIDVCTYLMTRHPEVLCGGFSSSTEIEALLSSWWENYRVTHPSHVVFGRNEEDGILSRTLAIALYGDEGRGRRRGNTALVSMETVFGIRTASQMRRGTHHCLQCTQCSKFDAIDGRYQSLSKPSLCSLGPLAFADTNMREHSFLSKIPLFVLPCTLYKKYPCLLEFMLEQVSREFRQLCFEGVEARNEHWTVAVIGMKGDMKWHAEIGCLERYYGKKSRKRALEMCPECLAGSHNCPYEDLSSVPKWVGTMWARRPWIVAPSIGSILPFDRCVPERVLRRDPFHVTRLGIYRHFVASVLGLLVEWYYFGVDGEANNIDIQLTRAHGSFTLYCTTFQKCPALRSFSKSLMMWKTKSYFPYMNVKASDCALLLSWLVCILPGMIGEAEDPDEASMLKMALEVARAMLSFSHAMYTHGLLLSHECCRSMLGHGEVFLRGYSWLAQKSMDKGLSLFAMIPKVHMCKHFLVDMDAALRAPRGLYLNPAAYGCDTNEDVIGKICRLSRRADPRSMQKRVLQMYQAKAFALYKRFLRVSQTRRK